MSKIGVIARAGTMLSALAVLAGGITYAALQDTATLTDNTIASATANLQVSTADDCATSDAGFSAEAEGFDFSGVVPGGGSSEAKHFCLRNVGDESAPLMVKVTIPELPTYTDTSDQTVTVNNSKVHLDIDCTTPDSFGAGDSIQALWQTGKDQGTLGSGETASCEVKASMDANAFTGDGIKSSNFDLVFSGDAVNTPAEPAQP